MKAACIDDYIATLPPDVQPILQKIRRIVRRTVPRAQETISYRMPAFRLGRIFIYLLRYRRDKGNLKFPLDRPMPYGLIARVVKGLAQQYAKDSP